MSDQDSLSDPKDPSSLTAYERWELPTLEEGHPSSTGSGKARSVKPLTANDIEAIRAEAYKDGFKQGVSEGRKEGIQQGLAEGRELGREQGLHEGRKQAAQELVDNKASLERLCVALLDPIEEQRQNMEQVLVNTTLALVRAVIHAETTQNPNMIQMALASALDSLPKSASGVSIQLHPDDHKLVADLLRSVDTDARVLPNAGLTRGGCIVETSQQVIDYTIEARFQQAVQKMLLNAAQNQNFEVHPETPNTLANRSDFHKDVLDAGLLKASDSPSEPDDQSGQESSTEGEQDV